jgi:hypothetical protein
MKKLVFCFTLVFASAVLLAVPATSQAFDCKPDRQVIEQLRFEIMDYRTGVCWYSLSPDWSPNLIYRSYLYDQDGYLMIFNSFGNGPENASTGAREYMFFPRLRMISATLGKSDVTIHLPNGADMTYDGKTLSWIGAKGIKLQESPDIRPNNKGGIELLPESGLMVDFGWKLGSAPAGNRKGIATIVDSFGKNCTVRNSDLLSWNSSGDPSFKFASDNDFFTFVRSSCPGLSF